MSALFTISGEAGKTWDATRRTLGAAGMDAAQKLTQRALEVSTIPWTQKPGTPPPDWRQALTLYRDDVLIWRGFVTKRQFVWMNGTNPTYQCEAADAMWWLANTGIDGVNADSTANRATFYAPQQSLALTIQQLLNRATTIGLPIRAGNIDPMFTVQQRTFSGGTFLSILVEILKMCPDATAWIDYTAPGYPTVNIVRRGASMVPVTLALGKDHVAGCGIEPRLDLVPSGVRVTTASYNAAGQIVYSSQLAGNAAGAQIVAVSGPEVGSYLPPTNLPSTQVQTTAIVNTWAEAKALDATIAQVIASTGDFTPVQYGGADSLRTSSGATTTNNITVPFPTIRNTSTGAVVAANTQYRYTTGATVDFMKTDLGVVESTLKVTATYRLQVAGDLTAAPPSIKALIGAGKCQYISGYIAGASGQLTNYYVTAEYTVTGINRSYPGLTTLYPKLAQQFLQAPAGLAQSLFDAQNFTPWEGPVDLNPKMGWRRWLGCKLNVTGGDPDAATAGAMVQQQITSLQTGAVSLQCGAPARIAMSAVAGKYLSSDEMENLIKL